MGLTLETKSNTISTMEKIQVKIISLVLKWPDVSIIIVLNFGMFEKVVRLYQLILCYLNQTNLHVIYNVAVSYQNQRSFYIMFWILNNPAVWVANVENVHLLLSPNMENISKCINVKHLLCYFELLHHTL